MKKIAVIILALMLCIGCASAAQSSPAKDELPKAGLAFTYPAAMSDTEGIVGTDGEFNIGDSIFYAYWYYCGATQEEFQAILNGEPDAPENRADILFYVFSVGDGRDFSAIAELDSSFSPQEAITIGQAEDWTFYLYMTYDPDFASGLEKKYADEYTALCGMKDEIAAAFSCSVPVEEDAELTGQVITFETTDLDGNPVSSAELFGQHEITMVNVWATWCGPCVGELGELQALYTRFLEKDCAVVGLLIDQDVDEARRLLAENGVTYPVVYSPDDLPITCTAIPTSFYVDRSGAYLGKKFVGAVPARYEPALDALLEQAKEANP